MSKKEKKGEKRHCFFSFLTEEIVELSYEHRCRAEHIASTLKRCYSIALGILKIVNILKDFTNASLQNTKYFNYALFQVIKYI